MRFTPAQLAVRLICGESPSLRDRESLRQRIQNGHDMLVELTGQDFGYDLQAWHDYLKESRDGGYTYGRNIVLPKIMQAARASAEWQEAARVLTSRAETRVKRLK